MLDFCLSQQSVGREHSCFKFSLPFSVCSILRLPQRRLAAQCCQVSVSLPYFRSRVRHSLGSPGVPGRLESRHHLKTPTSQKFTNSLLDTFMKTFFFLILFIYGISRSQVRCTHRHMKLVARGWYVGGRCRDTGEKTPAFSSKSNELYRTDLHSAWQGMC